MNNVQNAGSHIFGTLIFLVLLAVLIYAGVAFFRGPAKRSEEYANLISAQIPDPNDGSLFLSLYRQKGGKNVVVAWLLTIFLSPTAAYLYLGEYTKSILAFVTLQGLYVWWVVSWFTMPMETLARNRKAADDALIQLRLMRPQLNIAVPQPGTPATVWPPAPSQ